MLDRKGKKFNKLSALGFHSRRRREGPAVRSTYCNYWLCLCECGRLSLVDGSKLSKRRVKSCGCLNSKENQRKRKNSIGPEHPSCRDRTDRGRMARYSYKYYKKEAKSEGRDFEITRYEFYKTILKPCYYCGSPPLKRTVKIKNSKITGNFNGVDRVDNTKGYIRGNYVPCCKRCNFLKSDIPLRGFLEHINKIAQLHPIAEAA